jgi:hypothetical protein
MDNALKKAAARVERLQAAHQRAYRAFNTATQALADAVADMEALRSRPSVKTPLVHLAPATGRNRPPAKTYCGIQGTACRSSTYGAHITCPECRAHYVEGDYR